MDSSNDDEETYVAFMAQDEENRHSSSSSFSSMLSIKTVYWYLDSKASKHMSPHNKWFTDLDFWYTQKVILGNNQSVPAVAQGNISLALDDGKTSMTLKNVLVPDLSTNLLSMSALTDAGFKVDFNMSSCIIYDSKQRCVVVIPNRTYLVHAYHIIKDGHAYAYFASSVSSKELLSSTSWHPTNTPAYLQPMPLELWHRCLGHINLNSLCWLPLLINSIKFSSGCGSKTLPDVPPCQACILSKQQQVKAPKKSSTRETERLALIYSDVCGPMSPSNSGTHYFVTFTDDATHKTWVNFMKRKNEVPEYFEHFPPRMVKQTGLNIHMFHSNSGGE